MQPDPVALIGAPALSSTWHGPWCYAHGLRFSIECGETVVSPSAASVDHALNDHGRVGAAESEGIRQRNVDLALARRQRHEVDRRRNGRILQIDGRRRNVVAD